MGTAKIISAESGPLSAQIQRCCMRTARYLGKACLSSSGVCSWRNKILAEDIRTAVSLLDARCNEMLQVEHTLSTLVCKFNKFRNLDRFSH